MRLFSSARVEASADADAVRAAARRDAAAILGDARESAARVREDAERVALEAARADAAVATLRAATARMQQDALELEQLRELVIDAVRTVLDRECALGDGVVTDVVRTALRRVRRARRVLVRVHRDDVDPLAAVLRSIVPPDMDPAIVAVECDPEVGRGGAIIETDVGRLDARIHVQIAALARALDGG